MIKNKIKKILEDIFPSATPEQVQGRVQEKYLSRFHKGDRVRTTGASGVVKEVTPFSVVIDWNQQDDFEYDARYEGDQEALKHIEVIQEGNSKFFQYAFFEEDIFKAASPKDLKKRGRGICPECGKRIEDNDDTRKCGHFSGGTCGEEMHAECAPTYRDDFTCSQCIEDFENSGEIDEDIFPAASKGQLSQRKQDARQKRKDWLVGRKSIEMYKPGEAQAEKQELIRKFNLTKELYKERGVSVPTKPTQEESPHIWRWYGDGGVNTWFIVNRKDWDGGRIRSSWTYPDSGKKQMVIEIGNKAYWLGKLTVGPEWVYGNVVGGPGKAWTTEPDWGLREDIFPAATPEQVIDRRLHEFWKTPKPIESLPPGMKSYVDKMAKMGVKWERAEGLKVPPTERSKYQVNSGNAVYGTYNGKSISFGSNIGVPIHSAGAWMTFGDKLRKVRSYPMMFQRFQKFAETGLEEDIFPAASNKDIKKRALKNPDPNPFKFYDTTPLQRMISRKATREVKKAVADGRSFRDIYNNILSKYSGYENDNDDSIGACDTQSRDEVYGYIKMMRPNERHTYIEEDIFKPASKRELKRRDDIQKGIRAKEEEERRRKRMAELVELNKVPIKFEKKDEGSVSGEKTINFFGKKVYVAFTCDIEGGSMQTRDDPGEPAYPMLATITDAEDEDGKPVPITEALVEVLGDELTMDDIGDEYWGNDYDYDDYREDR